jgi:diguanylate cyclase (GGDEF)-like protein
MKINPRTSWFDKQRFKTQLTLVFVVGILLLATITSVVVSKISSGIIEDHQVLQGMQVTESLARQSEVALLYQSPESAEDIGRNAINFPGVKGIIIETEKSDMLFNIGVTSLELANSDLPATTVDHSSKLSLVAENENLWKFSSPVFVSSDDSDMDSQSNPEEEILLGYITVIVGKDTLRLMQQSTLRNNLLVSFAGAMILLFVLLYFTRRLTQPIERLSAVMERARDGKKRTIRARVNGPVDITEIQDSFNSMMQVLEDRQGALEKAMNSALESARVKGEFAANVTHELRTPMNAVLGMLDLLLTMGLSFKQKEYVETAKSSGESLLNLIDEILDFSEGDAGKISINNHDYLLNESLDDIVGLLSSTALKKQIDIGYIVDEDVPQALHSDSLRIRQVLINLAGNGVKFTDSGEVSIHVSVDRESTDELEGKDLTQLKFVVKDTGIGVSLEDQSRVFEAFTQVDASTTKEYEGTGLGLAISTQIIEMMGGDIFISSEVGVGSEFGFTLPVQTRQPPEPPPLHEELDGINALFVCDSEILQAVASQKLTALGVGVMFANCGSEALKLIRESTVTERFDILFVDQDISDIKINDLISFVKKEENFGKRLAVMLSNPWVVDPQVRDLPLPRLNKPLRSNSFTDLLVKYFVTENLSESDEYQLLKAPETEGCKVLIVDDNRANQQVAMAMLEKLNVQASVAENGQKALERVSREHFDLILMDCNMPVMSGYDATAKIRELEGDKAGTLPIIAMTANNSKAEEEHCKDVGMNDFLPKPLSLSGLSEKLQQWVATQYKRAQESHSQTSSPSQVKQPEAAYRSLSYDVKVIEALREAVGEVVSSMVAAFVEDTPVYLEKLRAAAIENNARHVREMAHTIKGSAANFGAYDLVELSRVLEDRAAQEDLSRVQDHVTKISDAFDILKDDLKQEISPVNQAVKTSYSNDRHNRILVVDDDRTMRLALVDAFLKENYEVEEASNGMHALNICKRRMPDLVLMDAVMPELDGFDACQMIRDTAQGADIPVLMVTALEDEDSIVRAFSSGATDYIAKPINFSVMKQRVARLIKANKAEKDVKKLAYHDPLTGLPNRAQLKQQIRIIVNRASIEKQRFAILFLDLDRFKMINDTLGHDAGDLLLKAVADRIRHCVRESDFIARLGGDEFTILLENIESPDSASNVAEKICRSVGQPFVFMQQKMFVTTSIGISIFPDDGEDVSALIKHADSAMFRAKEKRNNFCFYEQGMEAEIAKRLRLEQELRKAIDDDELVLHYQPQVHLKTGDLIGAEALVRWQHPTKGLVSPDTFIPLAEESGLINQLSDWVLENAAVQLKRWILKGHKLTLAVNLSVKDVMAEELHTKLHDLIQRNSLPKNVLELEITESTLMDHPELMITEINKIKRMGITIAIDDFGSGYSSLNYLKRLPVDVLKIDRSFIADIESDPSDSAIVAGIIGLGKSLNMKTVAEGVETEEQRQILEKLGCDNYQGYLFSKPLTSKLFAKKFLSKEKAI